MRVKERRERERKKGRARDTGHGERRSLHGQGPGAHVPNEHLAGVGAAAGQDEGRGGRSTKLNPEV
jgi:hypothetical protein